VTIDPTRRVSLLVAGQRFDKWTKVRITRGLHEIAGSFELDYVDEGRLAQTLNTLISPPPYFRVIRPGMKCELRIDGETVLVGWIGRVSGKQDAGSINASITGKDICGDLVDCAAAPNGPAEWNNVTLTQIAMQICKPFGIGVQAQTDIGAPFVKLALSPHDKALPAMEKAARQRAVLITSDGVANLLLTTAGSTRAPDGIEVGRNVIQAGFEYNWERRFSDVFVKGQTRAANGNHAHVKAALHVSMPPGGSAPPATATTAEKAGIVMTGHAQDPEITRWRPDVRMVNTQSGSSSVQEQAEWHVRVDRGHSTKETYTVQDFRAGAHGALWRPNQLSAVYDPYADIDDDMLIEGVSYLYDEGGSRTDLTMVGKTAYDRINEPARARPRHGGRR
jgi:prophage tail gpP-like protein